MINSSMSRAEILRLYKKQELEGKINVKAIKGALGYETISFIYRVIREYKKDK